MLSVHLRLASLLCLAATACSGIPGNAGGLEAPDQLAFVDDSTVLSIALERSSDVAIHEIVLGDQNSVIIADLYYDGLVEARGGELKPALALSWAVNEDFTRWTFLIDEKRVSPQRVVESFDLLLEAGDGSQPAALLNHVASVETNGEDSVSFVLDRPDAGLAWLLSGVRYGIAGPSGEPTGIYQMEELGPQETLLSSDTATDVYIRWVNSQTESLELLHGADVDVTLVSSADYRETAPVFASPSESRSISRFYLANTKAGDLTDAGIRASVVAAIDLEKARESMSSLSYWNEGLVPQVLDEYTGGGCGPGCSPASGVEAISDEAKSELVIVVGYSSITQSPVAESIAGDLTAAGFVSQAIRFEPTDLASAITSGEVDLFSFGVAAESGSPGALIGPLLSAGSSLNLAEVGSTEVEDLIAEASSTGDDSQRWALLSEAHRLALEAQILVPIGTAHSELVWLDFEAKGMPVRPDGSIEIETTG